jgi:hypothetical protein
VPGKQSKGLVVQQMALQALGSLCSHTGKVRLWSSTRQGRGVDTVILDRINCWDRVGPTSSSTRIIHRLEIPPLRRPRQHVLGTRSAPNRSLPKPLRLPTSEKRAGVDGVQSTDAWESLANLEYSWLPKSIRDDQSDMRLLRQG